MVLHEKIKIFVFFDITLDYDSKRKNMLAF